MDGTCSKKKICLKHSLVEALIVRKTSHREQLFSMVNKKINKQKFMHLSQIKICFVIIEDILF